MKKKMLLTFVFVFVILGVFAQSEFQKGYLITNENDTIYGHIDKRTEFFNCSYCVFKTNLTEESITYLPEDIKSYRFNEGKYYISHYVEDFNKYVFLEFLINGIVDVYYYTAIGDYYFVKKENESLQLLDKITTDVKIVGSKMYETKSTKHIGILNYYLSDSPQLKEKISKVELNHKSLIKLSKDYHNQVCSDYECIIYEKKIPAVKFKLSALVFANYTGYKLNYLTKDLFTHIETYYKRDLNSDVGFELGLGGDIYLPRLYERISIYTQLLYGNQHFKYNSVEDLIFKTIVTSEEYFISTISNDIGIKYRSPRKGITPEILFAYTMSRVIFRNKSYATITDHIDFTGEEIIRDNPGVFDIVKTRGLLFGLGFNFHMFKKFDTNFNVQYNYHLPNSELQMNKLRLGFGISF